MTSNDSDRRHLIDVIRTDFAGLIERGEVDVVEGGHEGEVEIQADQWTIALQGNPPSVAFLAIDDEPAAPDEMMPSLQAVIEPGDLAAIRSLDHRLNGALRQALQQSADMLSLELATWLAEDEESSREEVEM